ncbi:MAG: hypothetical protein KGL39_17005, partial [Patescibacteria group bacterium]|nr:hypothetical protein [Patescibacteria group bacterium]
TPSGKSPRRSEGRMSRWRSRIAKHIPALVTLVLGIAASPEKTRALLQVFGMDSMPSFDETLSQFARYGCFGVTCLLLLSINRDWLYAWFIQHPDADRLNRIRSRLSELMAMVPERKLNTWVCPDRGVTNWKVEIRSYLLGAFGREIVDEFDACAKAEDNDLRVRRLIQGLIDNLAVSQLR